LPSRPTKLGAHVDIADGDLAVNEPGTILDAYRAFHPYSVGNQLLAWAQCVQRGLPPGPLATFPRWRALGRHVRKGEKALTLCQPVTIKMKKNRADDPGVDDDTTFTRFVYRPHWFVLAQTDGDPVAWIDCPAWDRTTALQTLSVAEVPFDAVDGNILGFARGRAVAVSPLNPLPHKTLFHELAHVVLGHTTDGEQADAEVTPRSLQECEAEAVALLCCAALDLPGVEHCRGYIQGWHGQGHAIPERSAQRILKAADQILKAGTTRHEADERG
jgi:antirestriction protein ArdC